jgi:peptidoglycan/LPS O-acetylase OafA/YrhL
MILKSTVKKSIDIHIEALRGFCALMVLVYHSIIYSDVLDSGFNFRKTIIPYAPDGHLMVLIFFMLSGYVIGLNHLNRKFILSDYLKRRIVRLYPVYIIAIIITAVIFTDEWQNIVGALGFVQNLVTNVPIHNQALWSLNYEVIYYILVIPVLFYSVKPEIFITCTLLLLGVSVFKFPFPLIIEGYLVGLIFWFTGFVISSIKLGQSHTEIVSADKLVSVFFLLLSCAFLNPFGKIISQIHFLHGALFHSLDGIVSVNDVSFLPVCLYAIIMASSTNIKWNKFLAGFIYVATWLYLIFLIKNGSFFKTNIFYVPAFFLIVSTALLFSPIQIFKSTSLFIKAGSISYAIYVIHTPILAFIGQSGYFTGNFLSFLVRCAILFIVVIAISYFLEKLIQPKIKKLFFKRTTI